MRRARARREGAADLVGRLRVHRLDGGRELVVVDLSVPTLVDRVERLLQGFVVVDREVARPAAGAAAAAEALPRLGRIGHVAELVLELARLAPHLRRLRLDGGRIVDDAARLRHQRLHLLRGRRRRR